MRTIAEDKPNSLDGTSFASFLYKCRTQLYTGERIPGLTDFDIWQVHSQENYAEFTKLYDIV